MGHYNFHRYYDPSTGRYISADPIGQDGGINVYLYGSANPLVSIDPRGRDDFWVGLWRYSLFRVPGDVAADFYIGTQDLNRNYRELVDANTKGADKYFHCKGHCEAYKEGFGGKVASQAIGACREFADPLAGLFKEDGGVSGEQGFLPQLKDAPADLRANSRGRRAASENDHCATACRPLGPPWLPPRYESEVRRLP